MQRNLFLAGPGGRFDLANPATQQMVRHVAANPADAPKYGASLAEIFQLQKMLERMATPTPKPQTMTVYDDLKNAALQQASGGMLGQPQPAPQMPPQMPQAPQDQGLAQLAQQSMAEGGLTSLPVHNFNPSNYAGGGIVAFGPGGLTDDEVRNRIIEASPADQYTDQPDDTSSLGRYRSIQDELERIRGEYANRPDVDIRSMYEKAGIAGELGAARQKQLEELKAQEPERKQEALRNFLMSTGFGMAAAAAQPGVPRSGGILGALTQPLSVGAAQAAPGYLAEQKELRNLMTQRDKELAELENQRRAEARGDVRINQEFKEKKENRLEKLDEKILAIKGSMADAMAKSEAASRGRTPSDLTIVASNYLQAKRDLGDKRSDAIIKQEGIDKYIKDKASYDPRYAGIQAAAGTAAAGQNVQLLRDANDYVQKKLKIYPHSVAIMELQEQDKKNADKGKPTTLVKDYEDKLFAEAIERIRQGAGAAAPAAAPAARAVTPAPAAPAARRQGSVAPPPGFVVQ